MNRVGLHAAWGLRQMGWQCDGAAWQTGWQALGTASPVVHGGAKGADCRAWHSVGVKRAQEAGAETWHRLLGKPERVQASAVKSVATVHDILVPQHKNVHRLGGLRPQQQPVVDGLAHASPDPLERVLVHVDLRHLVVELTL